jgi:hypothetical protein
MANTYGKVSGTFQEIENAYGKVSGTWQEADEIYAKASGTWELVFAAFTPGTIQTLSSGSGTFTVPQGANAIHIQAGVGGGGGAVVEQTTIRREVNLLVLVVDRVLMYLIKFLVLLKEKHFLIQSVVAVVVQVKVLT